jgi:8-oxo-dGTP pyrophosphatase MutT (NUDIX family)
MTVDEIVQRIGERSRRLALGLPVSQPPLGSDFSLNGVTSPPTTFREAAVLVPLVQRESGLTVLLTQRTDDMPSHAGQISFPGGRRQKEDADAVATALRETEEEVGLSRTFINVIGEIDPYRTGTGYEVTPVVGLVRTGFTVHADPREVADIFEVPLAHFLDEKNHRLDSRVWQGRERRYYAMPYRERYIWGATAGMLKNLHFVLTHDEPPDRPNKIGET